MIALGLIVATGLYFVGLGLVSILTPARAARFLSGFAGSALAHYSELAIRLAVGWAFLQRAQHMPFSRALVVFGWVLVITTIGLLLIPWRWHRRFAQAAVPRALRYLELIGLVSIALGFLLLAATFQGAGFELEVTPTQLLVYGLSTGVFLGILHFVTSLLRALSKASGASSEEELEVLLAPALQGVSDELPPHLSSVFAWATALSIAVALVGLGWLLVAWLVQ